MLGNIAFWILVVLGAIAAVPVAIFLGVCLIGYMYESDQRRMRDE